MSTCYEEEPRSNQKVLTWCILVVVLLIAWWNLSSLVRLKVTGDLRYYSMVIRRSDMDVNSKIRLLDKIDATENMASEGRSMGMLGWLSRDTAIREMLEGELSSDDIQLVERELRQVEKRLK